MGTGGPCALKTPTVFSGQIIRSVRVSGDLSSRAVTSQVLSALRSLTSVFGMGTGGPCALMTLTALLSVLTLSSDSFVPSLPASLRVSGNLLNRFEAQLQIYLVHLQGLEPWTH